MRYLILMRGIPGSGKTSWLENNKLKPYTLSPDRMRLMMGSPELNSTSRTIPQNNKKVWNLLYKILESRMEEGHLTVIDATHTKEKDLNKYRQLSIKYRYKIIIVEFDIPLEIAKKWNTQRADYKIVPESVLERMHKQMQKPLRDFKTIKPIEFADEINIDPVSLEEYDKVHFIGDLQGCHTVLMNHFSDHPMNDKDYYIFVGDLCDRGIENDKVIKFALSLKDKPNVTFIWGNHEQWLWNWTSIIDDQNWLRARTFKKKENPEDIFLPNEFVNGTMPQLINAEIDKKELRKFLRTFEEVLWFQHKGKMFVVSHAGISHLKCALPYIPSRQFIKGVGTYGDPIDQWFTDSLLESDPVYQVHGHRNKLKLPVQAAEKSFTLESQVEFGGYLRVLTHKGNGEFDAYEIINKVYNKRMINRWD